MRNKKENVSRGGPKACIIIIIIIIINFSSFFFYLKPQEEEQKKAEGCDRLARGEWPALVSGICRWRRTVKGGRPARP